MLGNAYRASRTESPLRSPINAATSPTFLDLVFSKREEGGENLRAQGWGASIIGLGQD